MTLIFIPLRLPVCRRSISQSPLAIDCPRPLLYNRARHGDWGIGHSKTAGGDDEPPDPERSEEHTSELQSRLHLVCRLLLEKKKRTVYVLRPPAIPRGAVATP